METLKCIAARRSVKSFDPKHSLSEDELRQLLSAAALAPSSFNMQNRHFVVLTNPAAKAALMPAAFGQEQVRDASAVIVITGDLQAHDKAARFLRNASEPLRSTFTSMAHQFYADKPQLQREEGCRSAGLAGMNLMLAAKAMGYDSCPMIGFDPAQVSQALGLDEQHPPLMIVVVGKPTKPAWPRLGLLSLDELVSIDRFGNHSLQGEVQK